MQNHIDFTKNLIKGRIAETVFEQMLQQTGKYTVLRAGYEHILPEIAQYQRNIKEKEILQVVRSAPDFVLFSRDKRKVRFVEIKYRKRIDIAEIVEQSKKVHESWPQVYMFIASPTGFYLDICEKIIETEVLTPLSFEIVSESLQSDYLKILQKFLVTIDI